MDTADRCRAMGLRIGDTIEGREGGKKWWNIARLTLLSLDENIVVWKETYIDHLSDGKWSGPEENANWSLDHRDWKKMERLTK